MERTKEKGLEKKCVCIGGKMFAKNGHRIGANYAFTLSVWPSIFLGVS